MTLELVDVYRKCRRCREVLPRSEFKELGKLCEGCVRATPYKPCEYIARSRGIAITESGRELLRQWRAEEALAG